MSNSNNLGVAAVDRAFAIVDAIAKQSEPISLADLARLTGFYKSTLLRLIASLEKTSLVARNTEGRYLLGPYAYELGRAYQSTYQITQVLKPILENLVAQGSESSSFHVYYNSEHRVCLLRVNSKHSTLDSIDERDLLPLKKGAAGKLITRFHEKSTLANKNNVMELSIGERDINCAAVACAVFGAANEFVGAISLSGPKARFCEGTIKKLSSMVQEAAQKATSQLGGDWPAK